MDFVTLVPIFVLMKTSRRVTVYFDPAVHKALRLKAAHSEKSVSELVNAAVRSSLAEDGKDLAAFQARENEPNLSVESVLRDLRRLGKR